MSVCLAEKLLSEVANWADRAYWICSFSCSTEIAVTRVGKDFR